MVGLHAAGLDRTLEKEIAGARDQDRAQGIDIAGDGHTRGRGNHDLVMLLLWISHRLDRGGAHVLKHTLDVDIGRFQHDPARGLDPARLLGHQNIAALRLDKNIAVGARVLGLQRADGAVDHHIFIGIDPDRLLVLGNGIISQGDGFQAQLSGIDRCGAKDRERGVADNRQPRSPLHH